MLKRLLLSAAALSTAAYAASAAAQTASASPDCAPEPRCAAVGVPGASGRVAYEISFFRSFNPQTALDIVRQTPGFALNGGDDRRGFSGAVGNLLIDGLRPTSKSQSLDDILSRIPASQVVRVEVLRGAETAGDASGQAVLLNVVRTEAAGSGVWEVGFERFGDEYSPNGDVSYSGRSGQTDYGVGGFFRTERRSTPGWRRLYDGAGVLTETAATPSPRSNPEGAVNGHIAFPLLGGRLSANGQAYGWAFEADSDFFFSDPLGAPTRSFSSDLEEGGHEFELGANFDRDFGPWSLEAIALLNRSSYENDEIVANRDGGGALLSTINQSVDQESGESILRGSLSRALLRGHRIEFGGEAAYNTLDQTLRLIGDPPLPPIPNSNVRVEEKRFEAFGVHTWRPDDSWTVETRLAWETSTLTFTGDANQSAELSFWKPSIQVSRAFGGDDQVRLRVYRDVGQLNFDDFVSAAAIADGIIAGGNPDLAPQTDWRIELGADFRFTGNAALSLTLTKHYYTDVADLVLVSAPNPPGPDILFDAPGNIGDGEALSLDVNFSAPVPFVRGGRVTLTGSLWDSDVTDPVTGRTRIISNRPESNLEFEFRQDIDTLDLAWGVSASKQGEIQAYRFNEIDTSEEGPWVDAFIETTALPNAMRLRLTLANVAAGTINRTRRFFEAPDRTGPLTRSEVRQRDFAHAPWIQVRLSGTF